MIPLEFFRSVDFFGFSFVGFKIALNERDRKSVV
jgi:hypothetical protein